MTKFNYKTIKALAKEEGVRVADLVVMDPTNDPFYVGRPAELRDAKWFAEVWNESQNDPEMEDNHLRGLHYWIISIKRAGPHELPRVVGWTENGEKKKTNIYINNKACWRFLEKAAIKARDLGFVDPDEIADNRTPTPTINAAWEEDEVDYSLDDYGLEIPYLPSLPKYIELLPEASAYIHVNQPYLIEIWIEKSTLNNMLIPICKRYGVNIIGGQGFSTVTAIRKALERTREAQRPARILYISDYDPSGRDIPHAVARRIEFYQRNDGAGDLDIALEPIALTAEQVNKYDLPRSPEDGESVELDAMKVNYPNELRAIIEDAILNYYDKNLSREVGEAKRQLNERLDEIRESVVSTHQKEIDELTSEYKEIETEINGVILKRRERFGEIRKRMSELGDMLQVELESEIEQRIELFDYIPTPQPKGDPGDLLYESGRDYLEQLEIYKKRG